LRIDAHRRRILASATRWPTTPRLRRRSKMASAERRCIAHARSEHSDLWYYRDTGHGLEYLCADAYAQLRDPERLPWQLVPDDAM
jgi:hypothetical protein